LTNLKKCITLIKNKNNNKGVILKKGLIYGILALVLVTGTSYGYRSVFNKTTSEVTASTFTTVEEATTEDSTTTITTPTQGVQKSSDSVYKIEKISTGAESVILFNVPVVEESVDATIFMLEQSSAKVNYLVLDSPGGSVLAGARLLAYMKNSGKNIVTVCDNICASMAFQIFQLGSRRLMTEKSVLMAHPASGGAQGTLENMLTQLTMFKLYVDRMDADTAKRAGIDYAKFKALVADNIWAETPEALKMNLADGVVHLRVIMPTFSSKGPQNLLNTLKRENKWTEAMSKVKGYYLN
jgi:ATP-dependent protease ClpP protease subunit